MVTWYTADNPPKATGKYGVKIKRCGGWYQAQWDGELWTVNAPMAHPIITHWFAVKGPRFENTAHNGKQPCPNNFTLVYVDNDAEPTFMQRVKYGKLKILFRMSEGVEIESSGRIVVFVSDDRTIIVK